MDMIFVVKCFSFLNVFLEPGVVVPKLMKALLFALHGPGVLDPAVMKHARVGRRYFKFLIRGFAKSLRIAKRKNTSSWLYYSYFLFIPIVRYAYVIVRAVKMKVIKQQTIYILIVLKTSHCF